MPSKSNSENNQREERSPNSAAEMQTSSDSSNPGNKNLISMSTTFFPVAQTHTSQPDVILISNDSVYFYVHSVVLLAASQNSFKSLLSATSTVKEGETIVPTPVSESSEVLNVALHAIYNISCSQYAPTSSTLSAGVSALKEYGVSVQDNIRPSTPLFDLLLANAPATPLQVYTLAAQHDLEELAISSSPHLLSFSLPNLSDEVVEKMGPMYLKRLFFLHLGRVEALKRLLLPPPQPHPQTTDCSFSEQKNLTRAWALAAAYLAWDARPDMPGSTLESALTPLAQNLWCTQCRETLEERIRRLIVEWSAVKDYLKAKTIKHHAAKIATPRMPIRLTV